jgi:hypothetical protein
MAVGYLDLAYMAEFALVFNLTLKELEIKPLLASIENLRYDLEEALEKTKKIELSKKLLVSTTKHKNILKLNDESCDYGNSEDKKTRLFAKKIKDGKIARNIMISMFFILFILFFITVANHYGLSIWLNKHEYGLYFQLSWWAAFALLTWSILYSIVSIKKLKEVKDYFFNNDGCIKEATLENIAEINNLVRINDKQPLNNMDFLKI